MSQSYLMIAAEPPSNAGAGAEQSRVTLRYIPVIGMELQMAYLDDARHSGRNTYVSGAHPWPREFVTLALVAGCVAFWAIVALTISNFS